MTSSPPSTKWSKKIETDFSVTNRYTRHPENCGSTHFKRRFEETTTHSAAKTRQFLTQKQVATLNHPPYLPDLSPPDYHLFPKVNLQLKGARFDTIEENQKTVTDQLIKTPAENFSNTMKKLETRANLCITSN